MDRMICGEMIFLIRVNSCSFVAHKISMQSP